MRDTLQEFELLGYVCYRDKDGNFKLLVTLARPTTIEENQGGRYGLNVMKQYLPIKEKDKFNPDCIGKKYYLNTGINSSGQVEILSLVEVGGI